MNTVKRQGYNFYNFWVFKGKPTQRGVNLPAIPQIRVQQKQGFQDMHSNNSLNTEVENKMKPK